jgi:hypothetical protein
LSTLFANSYPSVKAQSEPKLGCQATVDKVLQEIRSKGVRRVEFSVSKGTANYRTGNPTSRTDVLAVVMGERVSNTDLPQISNIMASSQLMNTWANQIVKNCGNTAIVYFGVSNTDGFFSYYVQSDGTTKLRECLKASTPPSILPWGKEWGPQCGSG